MLPSAEADRPSTPSSPSRSSPRCSRAPRAGRRRDAVLEGAPERLVRRPDRPHLRRPLLPRTRSSICRPTCRRTRARTTTSSGRCRARSRSERKTGTRSTRTRDRRRRPPSPSGRRPRRHDRRGNDDRAATGPTPTRAAAGSRQGPQRRSRTSSIRRAPSSLPLPLLVLGGLALLLVAAGAAAGLVVEARPGPRHRLRRAAPQAASRPAGTMSVRGPLYAPSPVQDRDTPRLARSETCAEEAKRHGVRRAGNTRSDPPRRARQQRRRRGRQPRRPPAVHDRRPRPFDEIEWEIRDAFIPGKNGPAFEQKDVEFPKFWSQTATNIVAQKYFRGRMSSPERERSVKQMIGRIVATIGTWGRDGGYFADRGRGADVRGRAEGDPRQPARRVQLAGLVQRRLRGEAAVLGVLHPLDRRLDGLDPRLDPPRGRHLPRRLRLGRQPLAAALVEGAALEGRLRLRPGLVHARRRRVGRHDQVGRQDAPRGEDGRARRRPPRHRRVHLVQGARGGEGARPRGGRLRHVARLARLGVDPVPEREQLGARLRRVHGGGRGTTPTGT